MALLSLGLCPFSSPPRVNFSPIHTQSHSLNAASSAFSSLVVSPLSVSISAPSTPLPVVCGRGDKKTKKGKRFRHSYGNARPRNSMKGRGPERAPTPPNPYKKEFKKELDLSDIEPEEPITDFE